MKAKLWTGRILSALLILFLLFDAITKIMKISYVIDATTKLGFPVPTIVGIGIALLISTLLYLIPHTAILGAILLTAYLGGAVASQVRIAAPLFDTLFPGIFAALIWLTLLLRESRLLKLLPLRL